MHRAMDTAYFGHPAFIPFRRMLAAAAPPDLARLNAWATESGLAQGDGTPLRFVPGTSANALAYEQAIAMRSEIGVRPANWHDAFNALVWLTLPRTKCALNARHVATATMTATMPNARTRERDAATLIDESGLILACDDDNLVELLRRHAWRALFVDGRDRVDAAFLPLIVGHGLLDKLRNPYRGITAHVLIVPRGELPDTATVADPDIVAVLDRAAAARIGASPLTPASLRPLPVAGLAGWDTEALGAQLFYDLSVFRPSVLV